MGDREPKKIHPTYDRIINYRWKLERVLWTSPSRVGYRRRLEALQLSKPGTPVLTQRLSCVGGTNMVHKKDTGSRKRLSVLRSCVFSLTFSAVMTDFQETVFETERYANTGDETER